MPSGPAMTFHLYHVSYSMCFCNFSPFSTCECKLLANVFTCWTHKQKTQNVCEIKMSEQSLCCKLKCCAILINFCLKWKGKSKIKLEGGRFLIAETCKVFSAIKNIYLHAHSLLLQNVNRVAQVQLSSHSCPSVGMASLLRGGMSDWLRPAPGKQDGWKLAPGGSQGRDAGDGRL